MTRCRLCLRPLPPRPWWQRGLLARLIPLAPIEVCRGDRTTTCRRIARAGGRA